MADFGGQGRADRLKPGVKIPAMPADAKMKSLRFILFTSRGTDPELFGMLIANSDSGNCRCPATPWFGARYNSG